MADLTPLPRRDRPDLDVPTALAVLGGALVGGFAGYLLLTSRGARLRGELERLVERLGDGADTVLESWQRAQRTSQDRDAASAFDGHTPSRRPASGRVDLT